MGYLYFPMNRPGQAISNKIPLPANDGRLRRSKPIVLLAQRVLIKIPRLLRSPFCIVDSECRVIPLFHLDHGMVCVSEFFLGADCGNPLIGSLLVIGQ